MKRLITTSLIAASFLLTGVGEAFAEDGKLLPGSMCVRWAGAGTHLNHSAIGNNFPSFDSYVDCPVVKDAIANPGINDAQVIVRDANRDDDVSCQLLSVYRANDSRFWGWWDGPKTPETPSSLAPQTLSFGRVPGNSISHIYFSCKLPDRPSGGDASYIDSYRVDEY